MFYEVNFANERGCLLGYKVNFANNKGEGLERKEGKDFREA